MRLRSQHVIPRRYINITDIFLNKYFFRAINGWMWNILQFLNEHPVYMLFEVDA